MEVIPLLLLIIICSALLVGFPVALTLAGVSIIFALICIPLGIFDTAKNLSPKVEIWTSEKLPFLKTDDCVSESFEDSGIAERLNALLENLESR